MIGFLTGLLGGIVAWFVTSFLTQPLSTFINLRYQAAEALARYEDRVSKDPDAVPPTSEWLEERKKAYEACGSRLIAFSLSNAMITRRLYRLPIRKYYVQSAGSYLMALSGTKPGSGAAEDAADGVKSGLKLKHPSTRFKGR